MWTASQTRGTPASSQPRPVPLLSPHRVPGLAGPQNPFSVPQCQDPAGCSREPAPGPRSPFAPRLLAGAPPHPGRRLGKVPQERLGPEVQGGGPEPAGCWSSLPGLTAGLPAGKGEEQALAAAVLGLLCVQLGPGPKGEEFFRSLQPLLVSVLSDSAASPAARLHVSVLGPGQPSFTSSPSASRLPPTLRVSPGRGGEPGPASDHDQALPSSQQCASALGLGCYVAAADIEVSDPEAPAGEPPQAPALPLRPSPASLCACPSPQDLVSCLTCLEGVFSRSCSRRDSSPVVPASLQGLLCAALQAWALLLTICPSTHIGPILDR